MQLESRGARSGARCCLGGSPHVVINMRLHCPCAQQHNVVVLFFPPYRPENPVASAISPLRMASEENSDAPSPPSPKRSRTETEESIASLKIGDLRSLIRDTVLDVVKATSSGATVPSAGGSGSTAAKGDSDKSVGIEGRTANRRYRRE